MAKKEYRIGIRPTAGGDKWSVDVMHDGEYVSEMCKYFNHLYKGKTPNQKIAKLSKERAAEYIKELEEKGYSQIKP